MFADNTSLFSANNENNTSRNKLNDDLLVIKNWAFQLKMSFNPDPGKQAQEVIFSRKEKLNHFPLIFNNCGVTQTTFQKHLGPILDSRLII